METCGRDCVTVRLSHAHRLIRSGRLPDLHPSPSPCLSETSFQIIFFQSTPVYLLVINLLDGIWSKIRSSSFSGTTIHWRPQRAGEVNQNDFSLHTQHPIDFPPLPNRRPIGARLNHDRSAVVSSQIRNSASPLITITRLTYHLGGLFANPPPPPLSATIQAHCNNQGKPLWLQ